MIGPPVPKAATSVAADQSNAIVTIQRIVGVTKDLAHSASHWELLTSTATSNTAVHDCLTAKS